MSWFSPGWLETKKSTLKLAWELKSLCRNILLQTTNCSSSSSSSSSLVLGAQIVDINDREGKLALSCKRHDFLLTPPSSSFSSSLIYYFPIATTSFLLFSSFSSSLFYSTSTTKTFLLFSLHHTITDPLYNRGLLTRICEPYSVLPIPY